MQCNSIRCVVRTGVAAAFIVSTIASAQVPLGTLTGFSVLGGTTVTNTGPSIINASLGVSPGSAITGFPPGIVTGTVHAANAVALQAQVDLTTAYNAVAGTACNTDLTGQDLGGKTLTPGVYCFNAAAALTGTLTLDAQNNPNALFLFKIGSSLITASNSAVLVTNGTPCNKAFWQVGSSATLGTGSAFAGDILALASITLTTGANTTGRALARNGAVTLDSNNVTQCALAVVAPTLATVASPGIVLNAGVLTDSAIVSGRVAPIGASTITFRLYGPNDATCALAPVFTSPAVPYPIAGGPVSSAPFTPLLIGTYRWIASYSGDGTNAPIVGVCNALNENAIVTTAIGAPGPTIASVASPGIAVGAGTLFDSATVNGRIPPVGAATITFRLYGPNDATCANPPVFVSAALTYPIAGGPVISPTFTPTLVGTYRWIASYSGDGVNPPVVGGCNDPNESAQVLAPIGVNANVTITTQASGPIALGAGLLRDTATVAGRLNALPGASITFRLYGPNDATCTGAPVFTSVVPQPAPDGPVNSATFAPSLAGTYRWIASYSGDTNNVAVAGTCNAAGENVDVSVAAGARVIPTLGPLGLLLLIAGLGAVAARKRLRVR